ncbi:MAG: hypothetical protein KGD61_10960 [Candidatus Lokiarchaeota archaeon]|nr:hypothetical protein [Candidatus Lokiarchaeota archaeon]
MNKKKYLLLGFITTIILFTPFAKADTLVKSETVYLNYSELAENTFPVEIGDIIKVQFTTFSSPFIVGILWYFHCDGYWDLYTLSVSGYFEIYVYGCEGLIDVVLGNTEEENSGYIEYQIWLEEKEEPNSKFDFIPIIFGICIGIIISLIGVIIYILYKRRRDRISKIN